MKHVLIYMSCVKRRSHRKPFSIISTELLIHKRTRLKTRWIMILGLIYADWNIWMWSHSDRPPAIWLVTERQQRFTSRRESDEFCFSLQTLVSHLLQTLLLTASMMFRGKPQTDQVNISHALRGTQTISLHGWNYCKFGKWMQTVAVVGGQQLWWSGSVSSSHRLTHVF